MHQTPARPSLSPILPATAVAVCGAMWGIFWYPMRWFDGQGVGGAWISLIFNAVAVLTPLPWLLQPRQWTGFRSQAFTGLLLGAAFSLYTVSLVMTDVVHAILLFYLTPVWSTLAGRLLLGERLTVPRLLAVVLGLAGLALILGIHEGLPLPRNPGDWVALASGMLWSAGTMRSFARPAAAVAMPVFAFALGGLASSAAILLLAALQSHPLAGTGQLAAALPWIIALALVIFVPPNFLVLWAAQRMDPGRVGILLMSEVLVGAMTAALFSGDAFGPRELAGTVLIVCAGLVEVLGRR